MDCKRRRWGRLLQGAAMALIMGLGPAMAGRAIGQDELVERPGPPPLDDLETDANKDGVPDAWYNARDVEWMSEGGFVGPHYFRFRAKAAGRPARISRAFGVDGRKYEAILLGLWVRLADGRIGDRSGTEPSLLIQFYDDELRPLSRGMLGPWTHTVGSRWTRVVKRIPVPPDSRDAILSTGLMGGTGLLDVDGMTVEPVPIGGFATANLIVNGDFELGDPKPTSWTVKEAHRTCPGHDSPAALDLSRGRSMAIAGLGLPVDRFNALEVSVWAQCSGLRGADSTFAMIFFLDRFGRPVGPSGQPILTWSGSSSWQESRQQVAVPPGAVRAIFQINKEDSSGSIRIDDVQITPVGNAQENAWVPYHTTDATDAWLTVPTASELAPGGALDVSFLVPKPAGREGAVAVKNGRLTFGGGTRARFFGVSYLPQTAFLEPDRADAIADRLVRSGINLVRLGDLDLPLGPGRSLFDDARDDTKALDSEALAHLDHAIAALKSRGIYVALELQSGRRYRVGDGVEAPGLLPDGGGPAAIIDPTLRKLSMAAARALLDHLNPETGLALREDPALAWVTLDGEISLFDQIDRPEALPSSYAKALRERGSKAPAGASGKRLWEWAEAEHARQMAEELRLAGVRAPIAGGSHWRREREYAQAQAAEGLDLIDDRLYWFPSADWTSPEYRAMLWSRDGGLIALAEKKRKHDRPYVAGQWCNYSMGAWSSPTEAGDFLLGVQTAATQDWDAIVRRGVFLYPKTWGDGPVGQVGGDDVFSFPQVLNGSPHVLAMLPHAASIYHRGHSSKGQAGSVRHSSRGGRGSVPGWDPAHGRLVVDLPFTQAVAGWSDGDPTRIGRMEFATENDYAVLAATSIGPEPIAEAKRLLVTAVGRVEPTGFKWVDSWKLAVADPGRPPFLQEPVRARITWHRKGTIHAYALDPSGRRVKEVSLEALPAGEGVVLVLDGRTAGFHWEMVVQ